MSILIITLCFHVLQVMASKEATYPGLRCKNANISIEGLMHGDVSKLSFDDVSKLGRFL